MKVFILTRKRLTVMGIALAVLMCVGIFKATAGSKTVSVNATERRIPIYCVETQEKKVSISFDAAWGNEQTQSLLDILEKYNVKSTFFLVGDWVRKYPDDVKAIAKAGHDVGNHSDTHPYMTQKDTSEMRTEIEKCSSEIEKLTGKKPTLFRPPYGDYNNNVVDTVNDMGLYCVQWDVDSLDWKGLSAEEMCARIKSNIKSGSIVLMHNGGENTPQALPMIIECIQELGYEIVPISQLLPKGEYTTDHTGKMIPQNNSGTDTEKNSDSDNAKQTAAQIESMVSGSVSGESDTESMSVQNSMDYNESQPSTLRSFSSTGQGLKRELDDMINSSYSKKK